MKSRDPISIASACCVLSTPAKVIVGRAARGRGGGRAAEERGFSTQISVLIVGGYTGGFGWRGLSGELMRCTAAEGDIERLSC